MIIKEQKLKYNKILLAVLIIVVVFSLFNRIAKAACCRCLVCFGEMGCDYECQVVQQPGQCRSGPGSACTYFEQSCTSLAEEGKCEKKVYSGEEAETVEERKSSRFVPPKLQIQIPFFGGFTYEEKNLIIEEGGKQYYRFPWIGEYFVALFNWGTWAIAILAVIMIMVAGFQWMTAMGNPSKISRAKSKIFDALFGLILILGVNFLLSFINPNLTIFKPITIEKIKRVELNDWTEDVSVTDTSCPDLYTLKDIREIGNLVFNSSYSEPFLLPDTAKKLAEAASELKKKGIVLQVNNAFRTREQQQFLYDHRGKNPGCKPEPNKCNCPHMLGKGVDVVCQGKTASDPCQKYVREAMLAVGFCQLKNEAWHFEYPKISRSCVR